MTARVFTSANIERRLKFMDENGIDMAALSTNYIRTFDQCKKWNDYCAIVVKQYPKRFVGFATVPPTGGKAALAELERAIKELGLRAFRRWERYLIVLPVSMISSKASGPFA
jgi:predicted TIM-barrel fold metal-dependent hydrolase